ncbi:MAG: hypothetical protein FRX49_07831 [Trebouxia sp. A1-2]|nr:MAG: hypothetical protein FRX49_07831 [Trebouxia sp. A1-2]
MQSYWLGTQEDGCRQLVGLSPPLAAHDPSLSVHHQQGALHEQPGSQSDLTELDRLFQADHVVADAHLGCKLHPSNLEACWADPCSAAAHAAGLTEAGGDQKLGWADPPLVFSVGFSDTPRHAAERLQEAMVKIPGALTAGQSSSDSSSSARSYSSNCTDGAADVVSAMLAGNNVSAAGAPDASGAEMAAAELLSRSRLIATAEAATLWARGCLLTATDCLLQAAPLPLQVLVQLGFGQPDWEQGY